jgi:hemerythrin-like domain-containing protein
MKTIHYQRTLCPLLLIAGLIVPSIALSTPAKESVIPLTEDLMREHGILHRLLSIYDKVAEQLGHHTPVRRAIVEEAVTIMKNFIDDYHQKLEEEYLFPQFKKHSSYKTLVKTLEKQHNIGRQLNARIKEIAMHDNIFNKPTYKTHLLALLKAYSSMFRVHTAREDTELFPHARSVMPTYKFNSLSRIFEDREVALFGHDGFTVILGKVIALEKALGIYRLEKANANVR